MGEFGTRKNFIDHRIANAIHLLVPIKKRFFGSLLFQNKSQGRGMPRGYLIDKPPVYMHIIKMDIK